MLGFQDRNKAVDTLRVLVVYAVARLSQETPLLVSWSVHPRGTQVALDTVQSSEPVAVWRAPVVTPYCWDRLSQPELPGDNVWPIQVPELVPESLELFAGSVPGGR
jgi:hypothetical protein